MSDLSELEARLSAWLHRLELRLHLVHEAAHATALAVGAQGRAGPFPVPPLPVPVAPVSTAEQDADRLADNAKIDAALAAPFDAAEVDLGEMESLRQQEMRSTGGEYAHDGSYAGDDPIMAICGRILQGKAPTATERAFCLWRQGKGDFTFHPAGVPDPQTGVPVGTAGYFSRV